MRRSCLALWLALVPAALRAQAIPIDTARVDSFVNANMASRHLIGVSIGLLAEGKVVLLRSYGLSHRETSQPVDTLTRFAVGSVTKQFTAAIILQLADRHKLSLDDKVSKWFPDLTRANDIAVRDLLGHVSGYPDYYPLDFVDRRMLRPITADSLIRWYGRQPLDFDPGTRWSYSNTGFILLGRIAELAGGEPLRRQMRERIFGPLGMTNTQYEPRDELPPRAQGYSWFAMGDPMPAEPEGAGWAAAAGGIWSTPSDLLKWDAALMDGRVVGAPWLMQMTTPRRLANGASTNYGFGLGIGVADGDTIWAHGGAVSGFAAQNTLVPSSHSAVVVLSNAESSIPSFPLMRMAVRIRPAAPTRDSTRAAAATADARPVPDIHGPAAVDASRDFMRQLQAGRPDRSLLGDEFSWWLNDDRVRSAAPRMAALGEPSRVVQVSRGERGGMEVTTTRFTFASGTVTALMYRTPDGKIQEYLVSEP